MALENGAPNRRQTDYDNKLSSGTYLHSSQVLFLLTSDHQSKETPLAYPADPPYSAVSTALLPEICMPSRVNEPVKVPERSLSPSLMAHGFGALHRSMQVCAENSVFVSLHELFFVRQQRALRPAPCAVDPLLPPVPIS
jgi:hypothetical protein